MTPSERPFFDDSLARLVNAVKNSLGEGELQAGVILRDASGRLSFVSANDAVSDVRRVQVENAMKDALGVYARPDRVIAFADDPGAKRILNAPLKLPTSISGLDCHLVDRRIVGSGWLDAPNDSVAAPPRLVFASIKGGVGRSSALVVTAADLARRGMNVLVIDLDLEAPGVGHLLLKNDRAPRFGVVDFLVEAGLAPIEDDLLDLFVGTSDLTSGSTGRVDVLPAFGTESATHSENVLPKLSRAMVEAVSPDGDIVPVALQLSELVRRFSARVSYDVVLIDSRAGLAELTAPAVLNLGASVLLFGTAQRQTIEGYRALFASLRLLAIRDRAEARSADWRLMFKSVYAKAGVGSKDSAQAAKRYRDELYELFADNLYDADQGGETVDTLSFLIDDPMAPHWPLIIPFNQGFVDFDPLVVPDQLTSDFYESTFRPFLDGIDQILFTDEKIPTPATSE